MGVVKMEKGLLERMMEKHTIDIPLGGGMTGLPDYSGFDTDRVSTTSELDGLFDLPVYRPSADYLERVSGGRKGLWGYEPGTGEILVKDGLERDEGFLTYWITRIHEGIGAERSLRGYPHDDPTIARHEIAYTKDKGDFEAAGATARHARNKGWISHDEFLNYMKTSYQAGLFRW